MVRFLSHSSNYSHQQCVWSSVGGGGCCVLHVIKTVGSRFAVLLPSSLDGPSTPSSETQSLCCVQERRERRSQYLRERRDCKKLRRLSKRLRQAWEENERRSQLESNVNWWAARVLEPSWHLPQLTQNVPQAAALLLLFACGLLRSASLCAISAWDACDAVASFQQLMQLRPTWIS